MDKTPPLRLRPTEAVSSSFITENKYPPGNLFLMGTVERIQT